MRAPSPSFQRSLRSALALALLRQPGLVRRGPRCVRSHSSVTHSLLLSAGWSSTVAVDQLYGYMGDRANALNSTFQSAIAVGRMWCKINTWDHLIIHNHRLPYKSMYKEGGGGTLISPPHPGVIVERSRGDYNDIHINCPLKI